MKLIGLILLALVATGCNVEDVPPAHVGLAFDTASFGDSKGFNGPLRGPGSHGLDIKSDLRLVQCTESTARESFSSPTVNGIEFKADVYVRYKANCEDEVVANWVFRNVQPNPMAARWAAKAQSGKANATGEAAAEAVSKGNALASDYYETTVTAQQLFRMYVRPAMGMAVRNAFAKLGSEEVSTSRDQIAKAIEAGVKAALSGSKETGIPAVVLVSQVNLSKITLPKSMMKLNEELANKKTQKRVEVEEQARVDTQIVTEGKRKLLAKAKAEKAESEIVVLARAIEQNPGYVKYRDLQLRELALKQAPKVATGLGSGGGTIVFGREGLGMFLGTGSAAPKGAK